MRTLLPILLVILVAFTNGNAQSMGTLPNIEAYLLNVGAGNHAYSVFGHNALRLCCRDAGLDYCFSFETSTTMSGWLDFVDGKAKGYYMAVETERFLEPYRQEGRKAEAWELLLTATEKQRLWKRLDSLVACGPVFEYDFMHNNCSSMMISAVEGALEGRSIAYPQWCCANDSSYRQLAAVALEDSRWYRLLWTSLVLGNRCDHPGDFREMMIADRLPRAWQQSTFVDREGQVVGGVLGSHLVMLSATGEAQASCTLPVPSPEIFSALLLALALAVTLYEQRQRRVSITGKFLDAAFLIVYAAAGCVLTWLSCLSGHPGAGGNGLALLCNPLLALLLLLGHCSRRRAYTYNVCIAACAAVLAMGFLIPQMCAALTLLIVAIMARIVNRRCLINK